MIFRKKKKEPDFSTYPAIDFLNTGLRNLLDIKFKSKNLDSGIKDIYLAILRANGFLYQDVADKLRDRGYVIEEKMIKK